MITETPAMVAHLPLKAVLAQLRLQLRALERDASDAEAEEAESVARLDLASAKGELRAKLDRLVAEREAALGSELALVSTEAATSIAAAHAEASAILAEPGRKAAPQVESAPPLIAELPLFDDDWREFLGFAPTVQLPRANRAEVARLTLQLRAALDEAAAAEAGGFGWDLDASVAALRGRLDRLATDRQDAMAAEVELARASADAAVVSAREEAAALLSGAWSLRPVPSEGKPWLRVESSSLFDDVPWLRTGEQDVGAVEELPALEELLDELEIEPWITGPQPVTPAGDELFAPAAAQEETEPSPDAVRKADAAVASAVALAGLAPAGGAVLLDPETFARAVAIALAAVLDERERREPPTPAPVPYVAPQPPVPWYPPSQPTTWAGGPGPMPWWAAPPAPPQKKSFWADVWHADVVLWLVAMAIVGVVLLAWVA